MKYCKKLFALLAAALLCMALHELGEKAMSFTGAQAGITTFGSHTRGRIHSCLLYTSPSPRD